MAIKMASSLRFREDNDVPARIKRRRKSSLRPFVPVIVSTGGGGTTLSLFVEEKKQDETLNCGTSIADINSIDRRVYNPMPLQCYVPKGAIDLSLGLGGRVKTTTRSRKRKREVVAAVDPIPLPVPSIEEFPMVVRAIESNNGSRPVFLCRKKLEDSDVRGDLNRLFLPKKDEAAVVGFLNDEEEATVNRGGAGLEVLGVDERGKGYNNLRLTKWGSVRKTVIKSDWNKLVAHNNAEMDDHVLIWGFRHHLDHNGNGRPALVVVFTK